MNEEKGLDPRVSLITLGVRDLEQSARFYRDVVGWTRSSVGGDEVAFFELNGLVLALFPRDDLAADAGVDSMAGVDGYSRVSIAHNVRSPERVDRTLDRVRGRGGRVVKDARDTFWGGRSGYFADPDGFLWEVAWNPHFPMRDDGSVELPD